MRVVVIGAGLGGLSAAAYSRQRGHDVLVVDAGSRPGGRAGLVEGLGYRLDNGPSVLTMPELLDDVFGAVGATLDEFCPIKKVDPMYRAVYADGSELHIRHGLEAMTAEINGFSGPKDAEAFGRFCTWLKDLNDVEVPNFIDANFGPGRLKGLVELARPLGPALQLIRLGGFGKLGPKVASFFDDERLRRIFSFQAMYAGLAPYDALALYAVITYMDSVKGVYVPEGGMHMLASGLAEALTKADVELQFDTEVRTILRANGSMGRVTGVELTTGERIAADVVVCNADLPVAYRTLLGGVDAPRVARRGKYSPSCVLWIAGVKGTPPANAAHHNIHFGHDWDGAFKALIKDGALMPDPSVLVSLHSLSCPSLAPEGKSTLYVLEPVPNLDGTIDWSRERNRFTADLKRRVAGFGYPVDVEIEEVIDPLDWERRGMERGTPFALSHTFFQTGPFRPSNIDKRVPGLVFTGSSTLPGVGVPMVLISGKLAAERIDEGWR